MLRFFTALGILTICSCAIEPLPAGQTISVGSSEHGYLRDAVALPDRGEGYERQRRGESTRFGTATLIGAITRAAREVAASFPGGYPMRVGDLSAPRGGAHPRHRSHRAGRDADLLFFARDAGGLAAPNDAWAPFDRFGLSSLAGGVLAFDLARNWHLVRTLVMDDDARVKWLFCSNELKARLLRYAARHEHSPRAILRATWVLHEPSRGDPHDDHFHLRVGCSRDESSLGCRDEPPHWPWQGDPARKQDTASRAPSGDAELVQWLLAEQHVNQRGHVVGRGLGAAAQPAVIAVR